MSFPVASLHRAGLSNTANHSLGIDQANQAILTSHGVTVKPGCVLTLRAGSQTHEREVMATRTTYGVLEVEIKPMHDVRGEVEIVGAKVV